MRRYLGRGLAGGLAAAWIAASALAQSDPAPKPPRLKIEQDTIQLGEVIRGQKPLAAFVVRNVGGDTLRILQVKPG